MYGIPKYVTTITISGEICFKWQQYPPKKLQPYLYCVDIVNWKISDRTPPNYHYHRRHKKAEKNFTLFQK